jgi:hypothetical protein
MRTDNPNVRILRTRAVPRHPMALQRVNSAAMAASTPARSIARAECRIDRSMTVLSAVDRLPFDDEDCLPYPVSYWKIRRSCTRLPFVRIFQIVWLGGVCAGLETHHDGGSRNVAGRASANDSRGLPRCLEPHERHQLGVSSLIAEFCGTPGFAQKLLIQRGIGGFCAGG